MIPRHCVCIGCGLADRRVEAGGIYYCPNPACTAVGAYWSRRELASFKDIPEENKYIIDTEELIRYVDSIDEELEEEVSIAAEKCISLFWGKGIEE